MRPYTVEAWALSNYYVPSQTPIKVQHQAMQCHVCTLTYSSSYNIAIPSTPPPSAANPLITTTHISIPPHVFPLITASLFASFVFTTPTCPVNVPSPIDPLCTAGALPAGPNVCVRTLATVFVTPPTTVATCIVVTGFAPAPAGGCAAAGAAPAPPTPAAGAAGAGAATAGAAAGATAGAAGALTAGAGCAFAAGLAWALAGAAAGAATWRRSRC